MLRIAYVSVLLLVAFFADAVAEGKWPEKPIKLIVPYPPGGIADVLARHIGRILQEDLGQPVVIDNRGGSGSNIGSQFVARSAPDGYTILLGSSANALNMSLYRNLSYDTLRDFVPVSLLADAPTVLVVNADFPVKSVRELIEFAKRNSDLTYASGGLGSPGHLAAEVFKSLAGVKMHHIPYKGGGPAVLDVMAGFVPLTFTNIAAVSGGIEGGKLRLVAVGSANRWLFYPDVPTIAEAGVPGYEATAWYGLMAPAGTPAAVIARLEKALEGARSTASMDRIRKLGALPVISSPAELRARLEADVDAYAKLVKEAGITIE